MPLIWSLLDLVMPGIDGFEVLRRRQNMEGFKDTPVIVLTNTESVSSQSEAFALGRMNSLSNR